MRELTTLGIVLYHKPKHEYDRFVSLFTDSFGKISATAKYAQKPTSPFVGRLDTTNVCRLNLYKSTKGTFTIRQCIIAKTFDNIKPDLLLFTLASAVLEIADKLTYPRRGMKKYFMLIYKALFMLDKNIKPYLVYLIFKIKFLNLLGLIPSFKHCMICHKKIALDDITVWGAESVICVSCLENSDKRMSGAATVSLRDDLFYSAAPNSRGGVFDANMLKFINFIAQNDYEKSVKIKISKEEIEFLETFLDEIWRNNNLEEIKSEKIIETVL